MAKKSTKIIEDLKSLRVMKQVLKSRIENYPFKFTDIELEFESGLVGKIFEKYGYKEEDGDMETGLMPIVLDICSIKKAIFKDACYKIKLLRNKLGEISEIDDDLSNFVKGLNTYETELVMYSYLEKMEKIIEK